MKKAIKICLMSISLLSTIVILIASFSLFSFADTGNVYTMPMNLPSTEPGRGYLEYVVESSSYTFTPVTLVWYILPDDTYRNLEDFSVNIRMLNDHTIQLTPTYIDGYANGFTFYYYSVWGDGRTRYYAVDMSNPTNQNQGIVISLADGYKFYGLKAYGNIGDVNIDYSLYNTMEFSFVYSQDAPQYETLLKLYSELRSLKTSLSDSSGNTTGTLLSFINSSLNSIETDISDVESVLRLISTNVNFIESSVDDVEDYLEEIRDLLSVNEGEEVEPPPPLDDSSAADQQGQIDDFVSGSNSAALQDDISNSFSFEALLGGLPTNASSFIWDVVQRFLDGSSKIFLMFISMLSFGLIKLLLGR